jgi:hypothetical protein
MVILYVLEVCLADFEGLVDGLPCCHKPPLHAFEVGDSEEHIDVGRLRLPPRQSRARFGNLLPAPALFRRLELRLLVAAKEREGARGGSQSTENEQAAKERGGS